MELVYYELCFNCERHDLVETYYLGLPLCPRCSSKLETGELTHFELQSMVVEEQQRRIFG